MSSYKFTCLAATVFALLMMLALGDPSAFGEKVYYPEVSLGEPGSGAGQLNEPIGLAVNNETGDVYVADQGNRRVEYFSATGVFQGQFNGGGELPNEKGKKAGGGGKAGEIETGQFSSPEQIAIDNDPSSPSFGDVYVTDNKVIGEKEDYSVIDKFSPQGEYISQITEALVCDLSKNPPPCESSETEEMDPLRKLRGVAVDTAGDLWVYGGVGEEREGAYVFEFNDSGGLVNETSSFRFSRSNHTIAVDSHKDVYLGVGPGEYLFTLLEDGSLVTDECIPTPNSKAMAIVPVKDTQLADDLLIDHGNAISRYKAYSPCGAELETFPGSIVPVGYNGLEESFGLAVGGSGEVYASEREADRVESFDYVSVPRVTTEEPSGVTETSITLHGAVNPEGEEIKECFFEYGTEVGVYTNRVQCQPEGDKITGNQPVAVSATIENLPSANVRSYRLIAINVGNVEGKNEGLVSSPTVSGEGVLRVGSSEATAVAQINPGGLATCFTVEYCITNPVQEECIPAGNEPVGISAELEGLTPNAECQFHIIAHNALNTSVSGAFTFKTFASTTSGLPDERVGEAVSAVGVGHAVEVYVPRGLVAAGLDADGVHGISTSIPSQATVDGEGVVYPGDPPVIGGNGNFGNEGGNSYAAKRGVGGGWGQVSLNAPGNSNEYVAFAGDLSSGLLQSPEKLGDEAPAGYANLYRRDVMWRSGEDGLSEPVLGLFEPLITAVPSCPLQVFGSVEGGERVSKVFFGGGNAGVNGVSVFGHLLFEVDAALPSAPEAPLASHGTADCGLGLANELYDYREGQLYLVSVLPDGKAAVGAAVGRQGPSPAGFFSPETSNAVSGDGSRVYWSSVVGWGSEGEEVPGALYVREDDAQPQSEVEEGRCVESGKACTVEVDASQLPGLVTVREREEMGGGGAFWTASGDGSKAFFTDEKGLTVGSMAESEKPELYEFDLDAGEGERLSDLSLSVKPGVHADVQGVVGTSEDGSYVYFVANGALTEGVNAEGKGPVEGQPNLYLRHGGRTVFVATLSLGDDNFTPGRGYLGDWQADPGHRTAEVTPDGHSVVFMSRNQLTDYGNTLEQTPLAEVYLYNAVTERVSCVSCSPSGEGPTAEIYPEFADDIPGELGAANPKAFGSFVPVSESLADYQPRVISSGGGRVFFDSVEPLVAGVGKGFLNVYEWEAPGVGSCTDSEASKVTGGCTFLLSGGQSSENSYFIDASSSGDDVFFVSREELSGVNRGGYDVLYDARVGGVLPSQPARCSGSGCQGAPPAAPAFATPASFTFEGPAVQCPQGWGLKNDVCVKVETKTKTKPKSKRKRKHKGRSGSKGSKIKGRARLRRRGGRSEAMGLGGAGR